MLSLLEKTSSSSGLKRWFLVFACREKMRAKVVRWSGMDLSLSWWSEINLRFSYVWHILLALQCRFPSIFSLVNPVNLSSEHSSVPFPLVFKIHLTFRSWKAKILPVTVHQYMKKSSFSLSKPVYCHSRLCCGNFVYIYQDSKSRRYILLNYDLHINIINLEMCLFSSPPQDFNILFFNIFLVT